MHSDKIKKVANFEVGEEVIICPSFSNDNSRGVTAQIVGFTDFLNVYVRIELGAKGITHQAVPMWSIKKKSHCKDCPLRLTRLTTTKCPIRWKEIKGE